MGEHDGEDWKMPLPDDPILAEAKSRVEAIPGIRTVHFLGRLDDTTFFVNYMVRAFNSAGRSHMQSSLHSGLPKMLELVPFRDDVSKEDRDKAVADMAQRWNDAAAEKADKCEQWVINQGLIALCTTFDGFLEDVVDVLLHQNPGHFLRRLKAKVRFAQIETLAEQEVLEFFCEEEVRRYAFERIEDRFRILEKTFGLKRAQVFDFSGFYPDRRRVVDGSNVETVVKTYKDRQEIVHRDAMPLKAYDDLNRVYELFSSLVITITQLTVRVHKTQNEMSKGIAMGELYKQLKSRESGS